MLVLSRRAHAAEHSALTITTPSGDVIRVVVIDVDRGKVRLGIDAPRSCRVMRDELLAAKEAK